MAAALTTRSFLSALRVAKQSHIKLSCINLQFRHFSFIASTFNGRRFTSDHEWIVNTDGIGTVGITDYAQDKLGEVVYVEMPEADAEFDAGDVFGALESVKAANDLMSPVSGTVSEINEELSENPSLVNSSPYEAGWIVKMKLKQPEEIDGLMNEDEYQKYVREQESE